MKQVKYGYVFIAAVASCVLTLIVLANRSVNELIIQHTYKTEYTEPPLNSIKLSSNRTKDTEPPDLAINIYSWRQDAERRIIDQLHALSNVSNAYLHLDPDASIQVIQQRLSEADPLTRHERVIEDGNSEVYSHLSKAEHNILLQLRSFHKAMLQNSVQYSQLPPGALANWSSTVSPKIEFDTKFRSPCFITTFVNKRQLRTLLATVNLPEKIRTNIMYQYSQKGYFPFARCLPSFFLAGFPKSATTDMYAKLEMHPAIIGGKKKEPHWWTRKSVRTLEDYLKHFSHASLFIQQNDNKMLTVDGSASTLWDNYRMLNDPVNIGLKEPIKLVAHVIKEVLPHAKFIVMLREPVKRLFSDYTYFDYNGVDAPQKFHDHAVQALKYYLDCFHRLSIRQCAYRNDPEYMPKSMGRIRIWIGLYYVFIRDWWEVFPPDQFLIIRTEDYASQQRHILNRITNFLQIDDYPESISKKVELQPRQNAEQHHRSMLNSTKQLLTAFYEPFNIKLARLLHNESFLWRK